MRIRFTHIIVCAAMILPFGNISNFFSETLDGTHRILYNIIDRIFRRLILWLL